MKKHFAVALVVLMMLPGSVFAQKAGSFIAAMNFGLNVPVGDFSSDTLRKAESGIALGVELRYALLNNIMLGAFTEYHRFDSNIQAGSGYVSYNFMQYGGLLRANLLNVQNGKLYALGSGGIFKPNIHTWSRNQTIDKSFESSSFFSGGIGICSDPYAKTIYELEIKYSMGNADIELTDSEGNAFMTNRDFNFFYINAKLSFNSKGKAAPPKYED